MTISERNQCIQEAHRFARECAKKAADAEVNDRPTDGSQTYAAVYAAILAASVAEILKA
jgi:hypothetical protein